VEFSDIQAQLLEELDGWAVERNIVSNKRLGRVQGNPCVTFDTIAQGLPRARDVRSNQD
jgi:hypothetical protein